MLPLLLKSLALAIAAMAINVAMAFGWVAIYSLAIAPGQSEAAYQAYAEQVAPWCSVIAGIPILFVAGWLRARWGSGASGWSFGAMVGILYALLDVTILLAAVGLAALTGVVGLSIVTKIAAAAWGGKVAGP